MGACSRAAARRGNLYSWPQMAVLDVREQEHDGRDGRWQANGQRSVLITCSGTARRLTVCISRRLERVLIR
jgi:hypothetical protein